MYEKDLLQQLEPPCADADENGNCDNWDDRAHHTHVLRDARERDPWPANVRKGQIAYLPHSCDEWIIGGPNEVRALIADLEDMLHKWDKPNSCATFAITKWHQTYYFPDE